MSRALGDVRAWSVTTWIIVICVGVFLIDGFLPIRFVPTNRYVVPEGIDVNVNDLVPGDIAGQTQQGTVLRQMRLSPDGPDVPVLREEYAMRFLQTYLHFSTARALWPSLEFWRLIGFQFLHANLTHLLFNMIGLFFFGPMVEDYLGRKRFLAFYLLCGIFGALMYLLLNLGGYVASSVFNAEGIPGLLFNDTTMPLVGASAGVFGVLMAGAYLAPNATVLLFFFLPMRLATVAYALVVVAFVTVLMAGPNAGGEAGHLGGALAGFYFIRHPRHLHGFFDVLGYADPTSHHYRHRAPRRPGETRSARAQQLEIDRILDKIHREGLRSLTEYEKRVLRESSESQG